jgi:hypothetical protein
MQQPLGYVGVSPALRYHLLGKLVLGLVHATWLNPRFMNISTDRVPTMGAGGGGGNDGMNHDSLARLPERIYS